MSLSQEELQRINAYWRASNYLAAGQLYSYQSLQSLTLPALCVRLSLLGIITARKAAGTENGLARNQEGFANKRRGPVATPLGQSSFSENNIDFCVNLCYFICITL